VGKSPFSIRGFFFMRRVRALCLASIALAPSLAFAHHGQDFLLVESPTVPHPGSVYLIANGHAALSGDASERASFEPALLFGATPRFAFELHAHTEKLAGENWTYEALAPAVHVLLTDPDKHEGLKVGLSVEYEIAAKDDGSDNSEMRLSVENGTEQSKWAANLIASKEEGGDSDVGMALGFRREVREGLALGVEAQSSFRHAQGAQILAATYFENERLGTFKLGFGGDRNERGRFSPVLHLGIVLRLH
jgi:hypothetical protein